MTTPSEVPSVMPVAAPGTESLAVRLHGEIVLQKLDAIEALLRLAEERTRPRTDWPDHLKRFPFALSTRLQRGVLRLLEIVFRDQREYNVRLSQALRESLVLHRASSRHGERLAERLRSLETQQERQFGRIDALRASQATGAEPLAATPAEQQAFDRFYAEFENRFRGSEAEIADRLREYLPIVRAANVIEERAPLVDLGCGRGEWLQLLRDGGIASKGVDINQVTIRSCRERGLDVVEGSGIEYLRCLGDSSVGAITAFHLIEHLPFGALRDLFAEAERVLRPGGVIIVETPNPENVIVGSHKFYMDPTHLRPLPPELVQFVAEFQGLTRVSILGLHPWPKESTLTGSPLAEQFNLYFRGPQDYAVLGYKA